MSRQIFWFSGWALTPFAVCFAVFWMVRRKSGWEICVLPCLFVCFLAVVICLVACDHLRPCNNFLTYSFFSCKNRALERDRPNQKKKLWCFVLGPGPIPYFASLLFLFREMQIWPEDACRRFRVCRRSRRVVVRTLHRQLAVDRFRIWGF